MTALRGFAVLNASIPLIIVAALVLIVSLPSHDAARHDDRNAAALDERPPAAVTAALNEAYARRLQGGGEAPITSVGQIPALFADGRLPDGLIIAGSAVRDDEGRLYLLRPESPAAAARLIRLDALAHENTAPDNAGGEQHAYRDGPIPPIPSK